MTKVSDSQEKTRIVQSIVLVSLIIIMDMSGLAGLTNQDMLEELNEPKYTDSDGDGFPDGEDASQR